MSSRKLLVADDSPTIQKVIRLALSGEGYEIQTATTGPEALEKIPLFRPDIVLVDAALPEVDAAELKKKVDALQTTSPQFILMSRAFEKSDEKTNEQDFPDRLVIPFDPAQLRDLLQKTLAKCPPPAPGQAQVPSDSELQNIKPAPVEPPAPPPFPPPAQKHKDPSEVTIEVVNVDTSPINIEHEPVVPNNSSNAYGEMETPQKIAEEIEEEVIEEIVTSGESEADEIEKLTRQTMEMSISGNEWNIEETGAKEDTTNLAPLGPTAMNDESLTGLKISEPTLPPHPQQLDTGDSVFSLSERPQNSSHPSIGENDRDEKTMDLASPTKLLDLNQMKIPDSGDFSANDDKEEAKVVPLSQDQIQGLINPELQKSIEKIAREILPDIAEKIIKQEIHKMLAESSGPRSQS